jgi:hypothetical protein
MRLSLIADTSSAVIEEAYLRKAERLLSELRERRT